MIWKLITKVSGKQKDTRSHVFSLRKPFYGHFFVLYNQRTIHHTISTVYITFYVLQEVRDSESLIKAYGYSVFSILKTLLERSILGKTRMFGWTVQKCAVFTDQFIPNQKNVGWTKAISN